MNFPAIILLCFLGLFGYSDALSQACCSGGVPVSGSLGLGTADHNSLQFLLTYDYNRLHDLFEVSRKLDDQTRTRITHSSLLEINYGVSRRITLTTLIPYIRQERKIKSFDGSMDLTSTNGLGDLLFLIKFRLIDPDKLSSWQWVIGAGPKLPTGRTDFTNKSGLTLVADMQPGSGSVDAMSWMYLSKSRFLNPNLTVQSITTFRLTGKNRKYFQNQIYEFGNEFQTNIGLNYRFYTKWFIDVFSLIRYRIQTEDLIDNSPFPSTGGTWIYVVPGFIINFSSDLYVRISGDIPIYRKLEGTQLTTSYKFNGSFFYRLKFKKKDSSSLPFPE